MPRSPNAPWPVTKPAISKPEFRHRTNGNVWKYTGDHQVTNIPVKQANLGDTAAPTTICPHHHLPPPPFAATGSTAARTK